MQEEKLKKLLARFNEKECSQEELDELENWFHQSSSKGHWEWSDGEKYRVRDDLKLKIDNHIRQSENRKVQTMKYLKFAATILLVSCFGLLLYLGKDQIRNTIDPVIYSNTIVPIGEKAKVLLSDGSVIILNGGTHLRYPQKFNRSRREVTLIEGEAFFDVKRDENKPFIVLSGGTETKVLGTAFNVRAYSSLENIDVTVSRGKVAVGKGNIKGSSSVLLLPGEQVSVNKASFKMHKKAVVTQEVMAWLEGKVIINNETFKNVSILFKNTYGIELSFKEQEIGDIRFSAMFSEKDQLDEILYAISRANNLNYTVKGKNVQLNKKPIIK
jgi:transmembrane sensor